MPGFLSLVDQRQTPRPRSLRWVALVLASLLLHVVFFQWTNGYLALPAADNQAPAIMTAALLAPPPPPPPPAVTMPKRKLQPRRAPAPDPKPAAPASVSITEPPPPMETTAPATPETGAAGIAQETVPVETTAEPGYKVDPPPPAQLKYDVQALRGGQKWHGNGMLQWEMADNRYSVTGEASVTILFNITVLNFGSEGVINGYGIAPVLYKEKPWRKAEINTHFQHDEGTISFSASQARYPYHGGEQDRASIIWQMASIGRGDPSRFAAGAALDIMVAGARDADTWRVEVVGLEEIHTDYGSMMAWHVLRAPRPGSYDQRIEFWLAPQQEWYPVKLRYTYANGDHLEMSLTALQRPGAQ
jgi:hypothetical protein